MRARALVIVLGTLTATSAFADDQAAREEAYRDRHIGFDRVGLVSLSGLHGSYSGVMSLNHWGGPYVGSNDNLLRDLGAFYDAVGRPDYADSYRSRRAWFTALMVPGLLMMMAGPPVAITGVMLRQMPPQPRDGWRPMVWGGVAALAVGIIAVIAGSHLKVVPTTTDENYRLAAAHNRALRRQLGLPPRVDQDIPERAQR